MGRRGHRRSFGDKAIERIKRISSGRPIVPPHSKKENRPYYLRGSEPSKTLELLRRSNQAEFMHRVSQPSKPIQVQAAMYDHHTLTYRVVSFSTTSTCIPGELVDVPTSRQVLYGDLNSWDLEGRGIPRAARDLRFETNPDKGYVISNL